MARTTRTSRWLLVAVLAVTLTSACTPDEPDPTQTSTVATPTPTPTTPTPSPTTSPEDEAAARADEVVRAWLRAQTDCLADPTAVQLTCFDGVAVGSELNDLRNALSGAQALGNTVSGSIDIVSLDVRSVDLALDLGVTPPVVPTVLFGACLDVSGYNIMDSNGQSIVPSDRPDHVSSRIGVVNYSYPDPTQWRVEYSVADEEEPSCAN